MWAVCMVDGWVADISWASECTVIAEGGEGHGSPSSAAPRATCQRAGQFFYGCTLSYRELWVLGLALVVSPHHSAVKCAHLKCPNVCHLRREGKRRQGGERKKEEAEFGQIMAGL